METPQSSPQQNHPEEKIKKPKPPHTYHVSWPVLFILVLVSAGIFGGWAYTRFNKYQSQLSAKEEALSNKQKELDQVKADRDKAADSLIQASADAGYITITEWGVKFKSSSSDGLIYIVKGGDIMFSSTKLMTAAVGPYFNNPGEQAKYGTCSPADAPLGILNRYRAGESFNGAPIETSSLAVKAGSYYYVLVSPNAPCSQYKTTQDLQTQQKAALKEAIKTLVPTN